jgi:hypothetical protein
MPRRALGFYRKAKSGVRWKRAGEKPEDDFARQGCLEVCLSFCPLALFFLVIQIGAIIRTYEQ